MMGYLVVYQATKGWFTSELEPEQKLLCTNEALKKLLENKPLGYVISAQLVDMNVYIENHPEEKIKIMEA